MDKAELEERLSARTQPSVMLQGVEDVIVGEDYIFRDHLTICVLTLENGFLVVGHAAPAGPENYNREVGKHHARKNCVQQIWSLEGYRLRQQLHDQAT